MVSALVPLAPALALVAYFLIALAVFAVRCARRGLPADTQIDGRPASRLLGRWIRHYMVWTLSPWERALVRLHVAPNRITLASLVVACGAGAALAWGRFTLGGWLYLLAGMLDILDGRVARASGRVTRGGAYFDSVIDRYAELAVFSGLALYYRATPALWVVLAAAVGSVMVSYARARAQGLGVDAPIGAMQRPERLFYLGVVVAHSPLVELLAPSRGRPLYLPTVIALGLLAVSSHVTAARRIVHTLRALDGPQNVTAVKRGRLLALLRTTG